MSVSASVYFQDSVFESPVELANAFQMHWKEARLRLYVEPDHALHDELVTLLRHVGLDGAIRLLSVPQPATLPERFALLLAELNPQLAPEYDGVDVTPAGLERVALGLLGRDVLKGDPRETLDEILQSGILVRWRALPGMSAAPGIQGNWERLRQDFLRDVSSATNYDPSPGDMTPAGAWLLLCSINPSKYHAELTTQVAEIADRSGTMPGWWHELRDDEPPSTSRLLAALATRVHASREGQRPAPVSRAGFVDWLVDVESRSILQILAQSPDLPDQSTLSDIELRRADALTSRLEEQDDGRSADLAATARQVAARAMARALERHGELKVVVKAQTPRRQRRWLRRG